MFLNGWILPIGGVALGRVCACSLPSRLVSEQPLCIFEIEVLHITQHDLVIMLWQLFILYYQSEMMRWLLSRAGLGSRVWTSFLILFFFK